LFDENREDFSNGMFESNRVTKSGDDRIKDELFDREKDVFIDRIIDCDEDEMKEGFSDGIKEESINGIVEKDNDEIKEAF